MPLSATISPTIPTKTFRAFAIVVLLAFSASPVQSQTAPVVSNVVGVKHAGKLVSITYVLCEQCDEWSTGKVYLNMNSTKPPQT